MAVVRHRSYLGSTVGDVAQSNLDVLAWFSEDERHACESCGTKACVSIDEATASFCLACGAVSINGVQIDADLRIAG